MTSKAKPRKPWYRARNIVLFICLAVIAFVAYHVHWALTVKPNPTVDYGKQMQALSEKCQPEGENAWPYLVEAVSILKEVDASFDAEKKWEAVLLDFDALLTHGGDEDTRAMVLEALQRLEQRGAFNLLHEATQCPRAVCERPSMDDGELLSMLLPELAPMRRLARALAARTRLALAWGDTDTAVEAFDQALVLSSACTHQATMIEQLVGHAIASLTCRELRYSLAELPVDEATLRRLLKRIEARTPLGPISLGLEGERLIFLDVVQRFYSDDGHGSGTLLSGEAGGQFGIVSGSTGVKPRLMNLLGYLAVSRKESVEKANEFYDLAIARSQMTRPKRNADPFDDDAFIEQLGRRHMLLSVLAPAIGKFIRTRDRLDCELAGTKVMLAVELFHAKQGRYPTSLDALVPSLLTELPLDPYTGQSFIYRLTDADGSGYLLYSAGFDTTDNGGKTDPDEPAIALERHGAGLDFVFNLPRADIEADQADAVAP